MKNTYIAGTAIRIDAEIKDINDEYVEVDTIKITIRLSSTKEIKLNEKDMNGSGGKYYYNWQSEKTYDEGDYDVQVEATKDSFISIARDERAFYLET